MSKVDQIKKLLTGCTAEQRKEVMDHLRQGIDLHPLEAQLGAKAEIILEAIHRAGGLTLRMIRGVIAEAAFGVEVVECLAGWTAVTPAGTLVYDYELQDASGTVRVQVKLQRSKLGQPMSARKANKTFSPAMFVAETQKTRGGKQKGTGAKTRPYRFGEFDILAVSTYPLTKRWDTFVYTVADWLIPRRTDPKEILKFQPFPATANDDWADDFLMAVAWLRSGQQKTIRCV